MQEENNKVLDKEILKEEYRLGKEYYDKILEKANEVKEKYD